MSNPNNKVLNLHPVKLAVLPGSGAVDPHARKLYESAYETWKLVWRETLLELDGCHELYSDHLTRQDYFVALYHGSVCIALCCFRRADLTQNLSIEDSWFKPWKKEALQQIGTDRKNGIAVSWLTIHPDYRRTVDVDHLKNISASERLCEAINMFLVDCKMDVALGITRNNRSVNKMSEYVGFGVFQHNAVHHGVSVDLIMGTRSQFLKAQEKYPKTAFEQWNERETYLAESLEFYSQEGLSAQPKLRIAN